MNLKTLFCGFLAVAASFLSVNAAEKEKAPVKSKAELKAEFKTRVGNNEFGDVFIKKLPLPDESKLKNVDVIGSTMLVFISYVDGNLDFVKLNEAMNKATGAVDKKGNRKALVPIDGLIAGANKYLGSKNMGLQKVGFTANNFRQRIEDGVPILCWLAVSDVYEGPFTARLSDRKSAKNADEWEKSLRKLEKKKIQASRDRVFSQALILGFNKDTNEYLVAGLSKAPVWVTERELKNVMLSGFILRY